MGLPAALGGSEWFQSQLTDIKSWVCVPQLHLAKKPLHELPSGSEKNEKLEIKRLIEKMKNEKINASF